jgi:outer membrane protein assembly factor BamB/actin-like ATPase involved in cell morphogenesis
VVVDTAWTAGSVTLLSGGSSVTDPVLVIDFGTSTSSATLVTDRPEGWDLPDGRTGPLWASAVCWTGTEMLVGAAARRREANREFRYRAQFKRALRDNVPMLLGDDEFTPVELVTAVLAEMRDRARAGGRPEAHRAVLTVPPSYLELGDPRADRMLAAGEAAGFTTVELLPEPVAAAFGAEEVFPVGSRVLVYDFGGGTFDAALVVIGAIYGDHRIPALSIDRCGGADIDASIARWLLENGPPELAREIPEEARTGADQSALADMLDLAEACDELKQDVQGDRPGSASFRQVKHELSLSATTLRQLATPWVEMTVRCCQDLLRAQPEWAASLEGVLLVGGSSRLPMVKDLLEEKIGVPARLALPDPRSAVVRGAARFARGSADRRRGATTRPVTERPVRWRLVGEGGLSAGAPSAATASAGPVVDGVGQLLNWRKDLTESYRAGDVLAEIRMPLGSIYQLRASEPGIVRARHASPGQSVRGGDWLLTAEVPPRAWKAGRGITDAVGVVALTPALAAGRVFTGTVDGVVEARAGTTGELCWRTHVGAEVTAPLTARDGVVYAGCKDGSLHALSTETGEPLAAPLRRFGDAVRTAPLLMPGGGLLFGGDHGRLLAAHLWWSGDDQPIQVSRSWLRPDAAQGPIGAAANRLVPGVKEPLAVAAGMVFALIGTMVHVVSPDPASDLLTVAPVPALAGLEVTRFTVDGDVVHTCGKDGVLHSTSLAGERRASFSLQAGEAPSRTLPGWSPFGARPTATISTQLVVAGEPGARILYAGTSDGRVLALRTDTLEPVGDRGQPNVADSAIAGLAVADGLVYATSRNGWLHALAVTGVGLRPASGIDLRLGVRGVPGASGPGVLIDEVENPAREISSAPAVADGSVFVATTDRRLYRLAAMTGSD